MNRDTFKEIRARLGLTQAALARKIGVHPITVTRWETVETKRGIPNPVARLMRRLDQKRKEAKTKRP